MRRAGIAGRRIVVICFVTAALAVVAGIGASSTNAGVTVGCYDASKTLGDTTLSVHWCWNASLNLTDLSWNKSQTTFYTIPAYIGCGTDVISRAGGIGQHTASQVFRSDWCPIDGDTTDLFITYWAHVVGGSTNLDFVQTNVSTS